MADFLLDASESWFSFQMDPGTAAFYAVFGFLFVFLGIILLIAIIYLLGKLMVVLTPRLAALKQRRTLKKAGRQGKTEGRGAEETVGDLIPALQREELPPELVAAITAAVLAFCKESAPKCDFIVRRIKRL